MHRDNRCIYMVHACIYVCCSDCVVVCGNVCCVAAVIKYSVLSLEWSTKCAAITGVGVNMSPHCFIKGPNGSASYTASCSKV